MSKPAQSFFVQRTCTRKLKKPEEQEHRPLEAYRGLFAYVLLGDPGAGKTKAFAKEAEEPGCKYIKARDFATFLQSEENRGNTLFIDALDEMRVEGNDGRTPLDHVRRGLEQLGFPRFRLSCREADWLGESDSAALMRVSPNREIAVLHLDPLSDQGILEFLRHKDINDPDDFIRKAVDHQLYELLRNPQTLDLLVNALEGNKWPKSRKEIYTMACHQLVKEKNPEHRVARRDVSPSDDLLLNAAGYLCALQLLSGIAGFALDDEATDNQHFNFRALKNQDLPLIQSLRTNLFQNDGEEQRIPVHRSIAEYLGACYLGLLVENSGLPFSRVMALLTGEDGGVMPDLRGLAAWLSSYWQSARSLLIERDPLGVVLYGDVRNFPVGDKHLVLAALKREVLRYPWFRSESWALSPFGALGTMDMIPTFNEIFSLPSRAEADQIMVDCVLSAIRYGDPMPMLAGSLETIARDFSYWPVIRISAVRAWIRVTSDNDSGLLRLAEDIRAGQVEDRNDEILGVLLRKLYPCFIFPKNVLEFLHAPKDQNFIGSYFMFWVRELSEKTDNKVLPLLLDQFVKKQIDLQQLSLEHQFNQMIGTLLVRGLAVCGDTITDQRLNDWLNLGFDEHGQNGLEKEDAEKVTQWFVVRPDRYKAVIEYRISLCVNKEDIWKCLYLSVPRLKGFTPPTGFSDWYLSKASIERSPELAHFLFNQAVGLMFPQGSQFLTLPELEYLESWTDTYPTFKPWLEPFISCPVDDWQRSYAITNRERKLEQLNQTRKRVDYFRQHLEAIRDGNAHPHVLHDLAQAYRGLLLGVQGNTPDECLENFLDGDRELVEAAYSGFRHVLDRGDLPTVKEIINHEIKGKMFYIRPTCLVGMDELYQSNPSGALQLDDAVLSRMLAFRFTYYIGNDPAWFSALIQERSDLVEDVLVAYVLSMLQAGKEHVNGLYQLSYNETYSKVACQAIPRLLEGFPLRARKKQLAYALEYLLKGALNYLDKKILASIVVRKLGLKSMDAAQRVYWIACGLMIAPEKYETELFRYIGKSKVRRGYLANFLHDGWHREGVPGVALPESTLALLIELLASDCTPDFPEGAHWVSPEMQTADLINTYITNLSRIPSETACHELERLLALSHLWRWHGVLRRALHDQRIVRRKALFRHLSIEKVDDTLANLQPACAADLAALVFEALRDIAKTIHDGNTNDYRQYWSYDEGNKNLCRTKPENDCRDALLSDLKGRLGRLDIDAQPEGNYAENKRADIRISFKGENGFNVPIEIKKDSHADLWQAIHRQLIPKYVRDPGADGYGIYLVFWFGGKDMPPPHDGEKPHSAIELENSLRQTLAPEENHCIQICVIDCALPR
ncbi:MAG: hypothetical protein KGQ58_08965 [Proteobacteria bacterium]|nr:hypothetical protein [Pseudomonadota bacterium]